MQASAHRPCSSTLSIALALVAGVLAVGLLLAFDRVVRTGVQQGVQRRAAQAANEAAVWRCAALPAGQARANCRWAAAR